MTLTAKQRKALAAAPKQKKAAMAAAFSRQSSKRSVDTSTQRPKKRTTEVAKARARPAPQVRRVDVFDPTNTFIPPSLMHISGVYPLNGQVRDEMLQIQQRRYLLAVTAIPGSSTVAMMLRLDLSGTGVASLQTVYTLPTMSALPENGGPTSIRWTKVGVSFENTTPRMYQGGRVYCTHVTQRLKFPAAPSAMTADQWASVVTTMRGMPDKDTQGHGWDEFGSGGPYNRKVKHVKVVDEPKYNDFSANAGPLTSIDNFFNNVALWPGSVEDPHPMSIVIYHWDTPTFTTTHVGQDITCHVHAQALTRWPIDTVPGQNQIDVPAAAQAIVDFSRKHSGKE